MTRSISLLNRVMRVLLDTNLEQPSESKHITTIFLIDDYFTQQTALQVGAQAFFVKPASLVSLACWIKHHTRHVKDWLTHEQWQSTQSRLNAKSQ